MKRFRHLWPAASILLVGLTWFWWQRETSRRLAGEVAVQRGAVRDLHRLRGENERLRDLLAAADPARATAQVKAEIVRLRQELATLEERRSLTPRRARTPASPPGVRVTRDLAAEKDALRVTDHKNLGQATPGAAFQTFVWAVAHDNLAVLTPLLHLSATSQEQLRKMWRELPAESQSRFEKPEQLVMMLLALDVLDEEAFTIVGETPGTAGEVLLRVNRFKHGRLQGEKRIPMRSGPTGWQLMIPDRAIEELPQAIAQASLYVAPPVAR